ALLWAFAFIPRLFKVFAFHAERIALMQEMSRVIAITKFCQLLRCGTFVRLGCVISDLHDILRCAGG
ncbi:MAG TPA: hypothetical protein DCF88_02070, partial [Plesiomonas shigelloides]|nr:hypothetical protein [Plesiomonas shigelloides]